MRKHRAKIYYSAGLISIILLPMLCIFHLKSINAFTDYRSIDLQVWDGKEENNAFKGLTKFLNSKKYTIVNLTGDNNSDKLKLKLAEKNVRELSLSKDTISGIKFHFGMKSEYWTFIRVLEIMAIHKAEFYVPYENDIWFTNPKPKKINKNLIHIEPFSCGLRYNYTYENEKKINWNEITELIKKYYLPIVIYFLMLIFTIRKIYK